MEREAEMSGGEPAILKWYAEMVRGRARISELERTLRAIVEMIDDCPDAPKATDSLPQAIRFYADGVLRGVETGVQ